MSIQRKLYDDNQAPELFEVISIDEGLIDPEFDDLGIYPCLVVNNDETSNIEEFL
jgi:hypothetical protein